MFLVVFSSTEHESLQIKIKNKEVLSVSVRFGTKTFLNFIFFVNVFNNVIWKH